MYWCSYRLPATYFLTICTKDRLCLLSTIRDAAVIPSAIGGCVQDSWDASIKETPGATSHRFLLMPNHVHALVQLSAVGESELTCDFRRWVSDFKAGATRRARKLPGRSDLILWQRSFFERIVRDEGEFQEYRLYIDENPLKWAAGHGESH